jgi:hypothetical protein
VTIELTEDQFQILLLAVGMAVGAASGQSGHDPLLFADFIGLANSINSGNPNWIPYEVPEVPKEAPR